MIDPLIVLLIGFSVIGLGILLVAHLFFMDTVQKTRRGMAACAALTLLLVGLQLQHLQHLSSGADLLNSGPYAFMLCAVPAAFYLFSRDVLLPDVPLRLRDLLHLAPVLAAAFLPPNWVAVMSFVVGAGYSVWLARLVYGMRRNVGRFRFEMFFFGLFALIAVGVLALVIALPWTGAPLFYRAYAAAIGVSVALVISVLLIYPQILTDIHEAARLAYANSTLKGVDVEGRLEALNSLMTRDKLYCNENLSLALLAEAMNLSAHQLSELINSRFGVSFPRYIRELRVAEAKAILSRDQRSSALSVGMMCGFGSQSAFYAAFREVTGESPAAFRKKQPTA
ncbi:AraC family transcriptional regulator [Solimonas fluminis]|uniref:AraC family transcriptional regulator n=1 Tax=Solimonas fluminis TaxID=2086571 RepID=A0A2S5TIA8_9GAMM|nr:helix-turn-helix domain-containing protein [Solimonas fluminis]PPE74701.1 AraC family transcriptional regulator [Solimonas fluminis]